MEAELKFTYKKGYTQFDIIDSTLIADNLAHAASMSYAMRSSYYDTEDEFFRQRMAVLRLRRQNDRYYITLKMPVHKPLDLASGLFERQEFEFELQDNDKDFNISNGLKSSWFLSRLGDISDVQNQDLTQLLKMAEDRPLYQVCLADYIRTTYAFSFRTSLFEICFDEGYLGTADHVEQFSELEFELLSGKVEDLVALKTHLLDYLPLIPMEKSKYGRAIAIADQLK